MLIKSNNKDNNRNNNNKSWDRKHKVNFYLKNVKLCSSGHITYKCEKQIFYDIRKVTTEAV